MTDTTPTTHRRSPRIRIESDGMPGLHTHVTVDGVDLADRIVGVDWRLGAGDMWAVAHIEFGYHAEVDVTAAPSEATAKALEAMRPELLRKQAEFLTRENTAYRTVLTDSESADGVLPVCGSPDHPKDDRDKQWGVYDCCEPGLMQMRHEAAAAFFVEAVNVVPALLDERDRLRAWNREEHDRFADRERANAEALNAAYTERAHLVALLAAQYPAQLRHDPNNLDYSIVYVELPTGQASWHVHDRDVTLFPHVKYGTEAEWDGHTTDEKYRRINELTARLHAEGGVEADGGHRGEQ